MQQEFHQRWQDIRGVLYISWGTFLVSFFLPAANDMLGWQAFLAILYPLLLIGQPILLLLSPMIVVANIVAAVAPMALLDRSCAWIVAACSMAGAISGLALPFVFGLRELDLPEGYCFWVLSLIAIAIVSAVAARHLSSDCADTHRTGHARNAGKAVQPR